MTAGILDTATDPLVAALLELLKAHANGTVGVSLGGDVVVGTYNHPAPLTIVSQLRLPALSVFRGRTTHAEVGPDLVVERVAMTLEYVTPPTPQGQLAARWPILNAVHRAFRSALLAGTSAHYSGADLEDDLAVRGIEARDMVGEFRFGDDGAGNAYPSLRATFVVEAYLTAYDDTATVPLSGMLFDVVLHGDDGQPLPVVSGLSRTITEPAPSVELDEPDPFEDA